MPRRNQPGRRRWCSEDYVQETSDVPSRVHHDGLVGSGLPPGRTRIAAGRLHQHAAGPRVFRRWRRPARYAPCGEGPPANRDGRRTPLVSQSGGRCRQGGAPRHTPPGPFFPACIARRGRSPGGQASRRRRPKATTGTGDRATLPFRGEMDIERTPVRYLCSRWFVACQSGVSGIWQRSASKPGVLHGEHEEPRRYTGAIWGRDRMPPRRSTHATKRQLRPSHRTGSGSAAFHWAVPSNQRCVRANFLPSPLYLRVLLSRGKNWSCLQRIESPGFSKNENCRGAAKSTQPMTGNARGQAYTELQVTTNYSFLRGASQTRNWWPERPYWA